MTKRRKSAFDLTDFAILKVPKNIYNKLVEQAGDKSHWSEIARNILQWWIENDQDTPKPEVVE